MYVTIPSPLTKNVFVQELGAEAYCFYEQRIRERMAFGKTYLNPLKTMYIWAVEDKASRQGYYSTLHIRAKNSRKRKNYGRS